MCGGVREMAAARRIVYTERVNDMALSGRLRAIADREQGDIWNPLTVREMAETCEENGSCRSAAFWRGYAAEADETAPAHWQVRTCPTCGAVVVPAVVGALRIVCPVCRPFAVREMETVAEAEAA